MFEKIICTDFVQTQQRSFACVRAQRIFNVDHMAIISMQPNRMQRERNKNKKQTKLLALRIPFVRNRYNHFILKSEFLFRAGFTHN